jgi:hypothetical protein
MHAPLDVAELHEGQQHHQAHQHDRLRGGERVVLPFEAIGIDLVDHQLGGARRPAAGRDVDDAEGMHEGIGDVDHDQEEQGRRQERQLKVAHAAQRAGAIHRRGFRERARDRLQAGEEEDEVVGDHGPGVGQHDQDHGVEPVARRVPQAGEPLVQRRQKAGIGREDEAEGQAHGGRGHGVGPEVHETIGAVAGQLAVDEHRQDQRDRHRRRRAGQREQHRDPDRAPVQLVAEHGLEILPAHPLVAAAEGRFQREGPVQRLAGGPVEEGEDQQQLGSDQQPGQPQIVEGDALAGHVIRDPSPREGGEKVPSAARRMRGFCGISTSTTCVARSRSPSSGASRHTFSPRLRGEKEKLRQLLAAEGLLEAAQDLVGAAHRVVEAGLHALVAVHDRLELGTHLGADRGEVA